jgi:hypothetical protein
MIIAAMKEKNSADVIFPCMTWCPPNQITAAIPKEVISSVTGGEMAA